MGRTLVARTAGRDPPTETEPDDLLDRLVDNHLLTRFQAEKVREGGEGELVLGHYRLLDVIGRGGMGTVYRAEHLHLRRQVAVKVMARTAETNPRLLHRFYGEARAVAKLQHPNIVGCLDAGRHTPPGAGPRDYYVMELIPGADLQATVAASGPLPPGRACDLFRQIAEALAEAHRFGLVHRDIKPGNILITPDWRAKLLDFGLALRPQNRMTEPGLLLRHHRVHGSGTGNVFQPGGRPGRPVQPRGDHVLGAHRAGTVPRNRAPAARPDHAAERPGPGPAAGAAGTAGGTGRWWLS